MFPQALRPFKSVLLLALLALIAAGTTAAAGDRSPTRPERAAAVAAPADEAPVQSAGLDVVEAAEATTVRRSLPLDNFTAGQWAALGLGLLLSVATWGWLGRPV